MTRAFPRIRDSPCRHLSPADHEQPSPAGLPGYRAPSQRPGRLRHKRLVMSSREARSHGIRQQGGGELAPARSTRDGWDAKASDLWWLAAVGTGTSFPRQADIERRRCSSASQCPAATSSRGGRASPRDNLAVGLPRHGAVRCVGLGCAVCGFAPVSSRMLHGSSGPRPRPQRTLHADKPVSFMSRCGSGLEGIYAGRGASVSDGVSLCGGISEADSIHRQRSSLVAQRQSCRRIRANRRHRPPS